MDNEVILEFNNYGFQYNAQQEPTLFNISFTLRRGEKLLIAGPSGCGKSTIVHSINGLIPFSYQGEQTGSLKLAGRETAEMSVFEISKYVGTVLQDTDGQFVGLTDAEDIAFSLENDCVAGQELYSKVLNAAKKVGIDDHLHHAPTELSGGQKQRVSLAGVMVDDVDILLFDEPLANLDPATGKQAIELIDNIQKETGAAVIIIEHRLEDVLWRSVDRIILMNAGRIVADAEPDALLSTNLLAENGIREPLYLAAMKYAGVEITPEMHPRSISEIEISEDAKKKLKKLYCSGEPKPKKTNEELLLEAENIHFSYEKSGPVIKDLSLKIGKGEMLAIVGTNGAGKSTFSKLLCGFEKQQRGTVSLNGADLAGLSIKERAEHIGYVMQNPNQMISKVMIYDEVALGLRTRNVQEETVAERVEEALRICGLWQFRNWPVSALSYGQKKRMTIASILVLKPELIILDEPSAGQDYRHYTEIMEFLKELNTRGITVVLITHDMHLMLEYASRAVVFNNGEIIADDKSSVILTSPEIIAGASLKETSLYELALRSGIEDPAAFVQSFIDYEREEFRS